MSDFKATAISGSLTKLVDGTSYLIAGANTTVLTSSNGSVTISTTGGASNAFQTFVLNNSGGGTQSGDGSIVADSNTDTLTISAGSNVTLTGNATSDTITIASTDTNTQTESFKTISVAGQSDVVADSSTDTLTLVGAGGMAITTNAGSDQITFTSSDTNTMGSGFTVSATTDSTATTITQGDDLFFAAGTGITCETTADGIVTISSTVTDTNTMGAGFVIEDDSGDEVTITENKEVKIIGAGGITTNWTDVSDGTDSDPYDLTITAADLTFAGDGGSNQALTLGDTFTIEGGTNVTTAMTSDKVTINATDTNETYDLNATTDGSNVDLNLTSTSGGDNSVVQLTAGSNITLTRNSAAEITIASSGGGGASVAGSDTQVQFNNSGNLGADANFTFDSGTDTLSVTNAAVSTEVKTPLISFTDGDDSITIQDAGYVKFNSGVTHSPSVKVNSAVTTLDNQWIKIAQAESTETTNGRSIVTNLLVTITNLHDGTDTHENFYATFFIHVEFTPKSSSPYYHTRGIHLIAETFSSDQTNTTGLVGWNPTEDLAIGFQTDSTPIHSLFIRAKHSHADVYVTHLGGCDNIGGNATDGSMKVVTGESFAGSLPGTLEGSSIAYYYGKWSSKILTELFVTGSVSTGTPATIKIGGDSDNILDRKIEFNHAVIPTHIGIDDSQDRFVIHAGSPAFSGFSSNNHLEMDVNGNFAINNGNLTIGIDNDGADRKITFGHTTLKSVIGISDAQDVFAINTDDDFESGNDFQIDASGNVTIGNGDLTVGGSVRGPVDGDLNITSDGNLAFIIDRDNDETGQKFQFKNNASTEVASIDESGNLQADGAVSAITYIPLQRSVAITSGDTTTGSPDEKLMGAGPTSSGVDFTGIYLNSQAVTYSFVAPCDGFVDSCAVVAENRLLSNSGTGDVITIKMYKVAANDDFDDNSPVWTAVGTAMVIAEANHSTWSGFGGNAGRTQLTKRTGNFATWGDNGSGANSSYDTSDGSANLKDSWVFSRGDKIIFTIKYNAADDSAPFYDDVGDAYVTSTTSLSFVWTLGLNWNVY